MDGPEVGREPVTADDLADAKSEVWLTSCLRKGYPYLSLEGVPSRVVPIPVMDSSSCAGFAIEVTHPGGEVNRQEFPLESLQHVASRAAQRLVAEGTLQSKDLYFFKLLVESHPPGRSSATTFKAPFSMETRCRPLVALEVPLAPLLRLTEPVGEVTSEFFPVFYTAGAFLRAERYSRKGASCRPPVETGAVLVGTLCSCPDSGEFFAVICDALEVTKAEQSAISLFYSSKSWARIQAIMKARQADPTTVSHRILGQAHGHNFPPSAQPPCESCEKARVCRRTSVFVSLGDRTWSRAVFHGQPWQLCHIFGLTPREEPCHSLFGLKGGDLVKRGFHLIPNFDTAAWPLVQEDPRSGHPLHLGENLQLSKEQEGSDADQETCI
jgi:hypothetical protein